MRSMENPALRSEEVNARFLLGKHGRGCRAELGEGNSWETLGGCAVTLGRGCRGGGERERAWRGSSPRGCGRRDPRSLNAEIPALPSNACRSGVSAAQPHVALPVSWSESAPGTERAVGRPVKLGKRWLVTSASAEDGGPVSLLLIGVPECGKCTLNSAPYATGSLRSSCQLFICASCRINY